MKKINRTSFLLFIILIALFQLECKKEYSCENCNSNKSPVAYAGPDQIIYFPIDSTVLDGTNSRDPDGFITNWNWSKISGPANSSILNSDLALTKVKNLDTGTYRFELTVTDDGGLKARDTIEVKVLKTNSPNRPPIANAGPDQAITFPTLIATLDGSSSSDPDNNIKDYAWRNISGPISNVIGSPTNVTTIITFLQSGIYEFELKVTDSLGLFDKDTIKIIVIDNSNNPLVDIYVSGTVDYTPVFWKNGQMIQVDNDYFEATSIAVENNNIYMSGTRIPVAFPGEIGGKYWVSGQSNSLGDYSAANCITTAGNDVYVAGWEHTSPGITAAKYWKNGQMISLNNGNTDSRANSIFVNGNDVYVAGEENNKAIYWKNGQAVIVGNSNSSANAIIVINNDIYVAGKSGNMATYWKNGQEIILSEGVATSIFFDSNDIYVAGFNRINNVYSVAKYWKNGQEIILTNGSLAFARSITVVNGDIYIAGYEAPQIYQPFVAKYWKNGIPVVLNTNPNSSYATGIVVKRR